MVPFLQTTAEYIVSHYKDGIGDLCVVLPGRRGGLFLRKYLAARIGKISWAPAIFSIEDFIARLNGLKEVEYIHLLFELYEVHHEIEQANARTFEEFLRWAPQLLDDFNEIDRCMADPEDLFSTLTEARAISLWNLDGQPLTEFEKKYLRFYQSLNDYYQKFTTRLLARNLAYQGLGFRMAAENIDSLKHSLPWSHIIFAGFNALTKAEEQIVGTLQDEGMATVLWDSDRYYLDNIQQEAGDFLRDWMRKWPRTRSHWVFDDLATSGKQVRIIGSPDPVGQVKYCGQLLQELAGSGQANETAAVVLLDENLLIPLLNSIPSGIEALNITAGLSLKQTPLASLFETIFRMHLHRAGFSSLVTRGIMKFHYRDVLRLLQHPYIQLMAQNATSGNKFIFEETITLIRKGHQVFIGADDITRLNTGLFSANLSFLEPLFAPWTRPADALTCLRSMVDTLRNCEVTSMETEYLYSFSRIFGQFSNLLTDHPSDLSIPAFYEIYKEVITGTSLPFYGEPLKGIQVMGMLETRTLDFENLIILSCNEELLPSSKVSPSFLPFDIKRSFGIPTYRHKDSVYAYHFYRLIQRAKNVWILYNTESNQLGGGERSRFLRQISSELPAYNSRISITDSVLTTTLNRKEMAEEISITKTGDVIKILEEKATQGFSASSLNAYRNCPLKFYYGEIAGIKEPEEVDDTIDPAVLGSAVHEALSRLYYPFRDQPLTADILTSMEKISEEAVDLAFKKKFKGPDVTTGKNLLLVSVAKMMVKKFLLYEKEQIEELGRSGKTCSVIYIEQLLETHVSIPFNGSDLNVRLKGFVDRVDKIENWWKIIDYKTGATESKHVKLKDWDDLASNPDLNIGFQLLMYAYLLSRKFQHPVSSGAGIISLKKLTTGFTAVSVPGGESGKLTTILDQSTSGSFETVIRGLLNDIYDVEKPFDQTSDLDICKRCPYINLCVR